MAAALQASRTVEAFGYSLPIVKKGIHVVKSMNTNKCLSLAPSILIDRHNLPFQIDRTAIYDDIVITDRHDNYSGYVKLTIGGGYITPYNSINYQLKNMKGMKLGVVWIGECEGYNNLEHVDDMVVLGTKNHVKHRECYSFDKIRMIGVNRTLRQTLEWNLRNCDAIHVVINASSVLSISYRQMCEITFMLNSDLRMKSVDLFNYNTCDDDDKFSKGLMMTDFVLTTVTGRSLF
jgi:hypothetical protein